MAYVVEFALSPATRPLAESLERSASAALMWFALAYCALLGWEVARDLVGRALGAIAPARRGRS
jgi:hypothetical protein